MEDDCGYNDCDWPNLVQDYKELPERENIKQNLLEKMKIREVHGRSLNQGGRSPSQSG